MASFIPPLLLPAKRSGVASADSGVRDVHFTRPLLVSSLGSSSTDAPLFASNRLGGVTAFAWLVLPTQQQDGRKRLRQFGRGAVGRLDDWAHLEGASSRAAQPCPARPCFAVPCCECAHERRTAMSRTSMPRSAMFRHPEL
eukprot:363174-Chlamydomonas_euryale.AAC.2